MLHSLTRSLLLAATAALASSAHLAADDATPTLVRSTAPDWPQWQGARRDGVSREKGLLKSWPVGGPTLLWSTSGIGRGYASPIVVGDTIYIAGDGEEMLSIRAISLDGTLRWETINGKRWDRSYPGARASCCYLDGAIYHMNAHGRLACLNAEDGSHRWAVDVLDRFDAENITWGISESVLVHGDHVFVTPAGSKALIAALDKKTGDTVWTASPIAEERASYASPILVDVNQRQVLVNGTSHHAFAVDPETGQVVWTVPHLDPDSTITTTPVLTAHGMVFTNASRRFGAVYSVALGQEAGSRLWSAQLTISHGGAICVDDAVYGTSGRGEVRGWVGIDSATGSATLLNEREMGSLIYADDRFYCLNERGTMTLQKLDGGAWEETGRFEFAEGKDVWAHPVICKGRLFLRYHDTLYCYDIRNGR